VTISDTDSPTPAIELQGVTLRQGARVLLAAVDLVVPAGGACAVVGTNGSGKSALLRVVAGLRRPQAGRVWVGGFDVIAAPDRARRVLGFVPDEPGLADRLTAHEHLRLAATERGMGGAEAASAADAMVELVDLTGLAHHYVGELSRGQRRRLSLALALVHDPPVLLLDEPVDGVDEVGRGELTSVLLELRSMEKTLLIASQSHADVVQVCDLVVPLVEGHLAPAATQGGAALTWLELIGEPEVALRLLRERPGVENLQQEGTFVTFQGPTTPEERSEIAAWLLQQRVPLAGFGVTAAAAGGERP
jgi:ABC-2 type transport system ATP-binding protein